MTDSLLHGFRALDLTDEKGFGCGQMLAALGVDVIKIEKPGGDPARSIPPFYHDKPDKEKSLYWFASNNNKRGITLDIEKNEGQDLFRKLAVKADFVLESFTPGYLDSLGLGYEALSRINRRIIVTSITHFGQKGPHSHYNGSELVDSAMSGLMDNTGDMDRAPVKEALDSVFFHAGVAAALGTTIAHYARETSGEGQQVDLSIQAVAASRTALCLIPYQWDKRLVKRSGPMTQIGLRPFRAIWPCKDGYVLWFYQGGQIGAPANRALSNWMDEEGIDNPLSQITKWEEHDMANMSTETHDAFQAAIYNFFLKHTKQEIAEEGLKRGINAVVECVPSEVLENPQLHARDLWTDLGHSGIGDKLAYPKHYFLCSETENFLTRPSPGIGQDNENVYLNELGMSPSELKSLREANVI